MILRALSVLMKNISVQKPFFSHLSNRTSILQTYCFQRSKAVFVNRHISDQAIKTTCFRIPFIICMIYIFSQISRRIRPEYRHMTPELSAVRQNTVNIQITPPFLLSEDNSQSIPGILFQIRPYRLKSEYFSAIFKTDLYLSKFFIRI